MTKREHHGNASLAQCFPLNVRKSNVLEYSDNFDEEDDQLSSRSGLSQGSMNISNYTRSDIRITDYIGCREGKRLEDCSICK